MQDVRFYNGSFVQEIHLHWNDTFSNEAASIRLITFEHLPVTEWDITLYGLPDNVNQGLEVTANWYCSQINNEGVFYTDSNGLEMQKRVLNQRNTWTLDTH